MVCSMVLKAMSWGPEGQRLQENDGVCKVQGPLEIIGE